MVQTDGKNCASCWFLSRMCITMHGSENVQFTGLGYSQPV
jgi:hypothetical protein